MEHQETPCGGNCASCGAGASAEIGTCNGAGASTEQGAEIRNCGSCANCGGAGALELTEGEIAVLGRFAQIPFWPVGRRADSDAPLCFEESDMKSELLSALALKGLIRIDYGIPLSNFDYAAYASCADKGSMALTFAGQNAVELLDVQGAEES